MDSATIPLYILSTHTHKHYFRIIVHFLLWYPTDAPTAKSDSSSGGRPAPVIARRLAGLVAQRTQAEPPPRLPLALRTAQHVQVSAGRFEGSWSRRFVLVKWVISGLVQVSLAGRRTLSSPGDVAIYLPSAPLDFLALHESNTLCWFTVDGPLCEPFLLQLGLHAGVHHGGSPPIDRIHEMMQALNDPAAAASRRGSLLAIQTLYELSDTIVAPDIPGVVVQAQHFIDQNFDNPELSASHLASTLDYHPGSLSRLFHRHTGVTVIDYIARVRLRHATSLLQHTEEKVSTIARQCGFRETTYFCRWLRKHAGVTARRLRAAS